MPELPRKPGVPVEEKQQTDPVAEMPTPHALEPSRAEAGRQGEDVLPATPAPASAASPLATADDSLPIPPASDDATPAAEVEEPIAHPLPDAGEAAAIGAMSAAEAAVRQRAEADYQRAIDDAIRAAQWRTDDDVYVGLVDELVRLRGSSGARSGLPSSASRAHGGDGPWDAPGRTPWAEARGGDGGAAYGMFGKADAGFGIGPLVSPAVYGADDERGSAEQVRFIARPGGSASPLPGEPPLPGSTDWRGVGKELEKLWGQLPDFDDLPEVEKPFFIQLLAAIANLLYNKPPHDAKDKKGAKAPGKPGEENGFKDPKGGEKWVRNPKPKSGGGSHGWLDDKGRVWVPTGPRPGRAHGKPHWDVQWPDGEYSNVRPGRHIDNVPKKRR